MLSSAGAIKCMMRYPVVFSESSRSQFIHFIARTMERVLYQSFLHMYTNVYDDMQKITYITDRSL